MINGVHRRDDGEQNLGGANVTRRFVASDVLFAGLHREAIAWTAGRIMNPNLQHYHVPVNSDVLNVETIFVEEDDKIVNPLGVKGMGELGMVGVPAAIANAVFHATGKRVRDLPITPDKLI